LGALALLAGFGRPTPADELSRQAYEILRKNCFACHGAARMSGLDLRSRASILTGGERGPAVVPSDLSSSRLLQFVTHEAKPTMPPGQRLSDADIAILRRWIEGGARFDGVIPDSGGALDEAKRAELAKLEERPITAEERGFWAFQPPRRKAPPNPRLHPVDAFLEAARQARSLKASPSADRRTLIRRAYLDLLGLPPPPEEVEDFVADPSPDAWPRLIDRLLASPHYGERWTRHWLDLVRYADSGGFEFDVDRPEAYRYRDYVVRSFNDDKPYDRFIREQLAGDEFAPDSQEAQRGIAATKH
jgi:mono/diheme cytochrome c family protein